MGLVPQKLTEKEVNDGTFTGTTRVRLPHGHSPFTTCVCLSLCHHRSLFLQLVLNFSTTVMPRRSYSSSHHSRWRPNSHLAAPPHHACLHQQGLTLSMEHHLHLALVTALASSLTVLLSLTAPKCPQRLRHTHVTADPDQLRVLVQPPSSQSLSVLARHRRVCPLHSASSLLR